VGRRRGRDRLARAKPLTRYFPELVAAFAALLPEPCLLDGEIVVGAARRRAAAVVGGAVAASTPPLARQPC
jgi:hypothetical protein